MIESRDRNRVQRWRVRPESWWWISGVVVLPVLAMTGVMLLVLPAITHPISPADRLDVIKTALSVGAGTGGVVTLVLAWRRQWHTEHDSTERRITELYGKAVEQLESDKAAVRLGGLYALERLAQYNVEHRQHIVNVLCAYLRTPYDSPGSTSTVEENHELAEEQVRLAAQDILSEHLRPGNPSAFWPGIDINLARAYLDNFDMRGCRIRTAKFDGAVLIGPNNFTNAEFKGYAAFNGAEFHSETEFIHTKFEGGASFGYDRLGHGVEFDGPVWFTFAEFGGPAMFVMEGFQEDIIFEDARFTFVPRFNFSPHFKKDIEGNFWVRLDGDKNCEEIFPENWSVESTDTRPEGVTEGRWVIVKPAPPPPDNSGPAE